ncbi:DUF4382 domain-containing protein [Chloroflexota bacterium]
MLTKKIMVTLGLILLLVFTGACATFDTEKQESVTGEGEQETSEKDGEQVLPEEEITANWGIIEFQVTDPPPADVKSAIIHLSNVEVHKAVAAQEMEQEIEQESSDSDNQTQEQEQEQEQEEGQDEQGEWISILNTPPSFDLMDVIGVEKLLGSANLSAGKYTQIRMDVEKVDVVTTDGENFTAEVPGDKLRVVRPFDVEPGMTTVLTLDFDGEKSLIITGKGEAMFKPVVKLLIEKKEGTGTKAKQEASEEPQKEGVEENEDEDSDEEELEEAEVMEFEGTIDSIDGDNWTMTINGESSIVDVSQAEIQGNPAVERTATIEGSIIDGIIVASEVEIKGSSN